MKKLIIASAITMSLLSVVNTASAANNEVQFLGAVSSVTCDLQPEVGGAVGGIVQLGSVETGKKGTSVEFALKADASAPGCGALTGKKATIYWLGNLTSQGLGNSVGAAKDAWVELKTINSVVPNTSITQYQASAEFAADDFTTTGAKFAATLNGGSDIGDFKSSSAFSVSYK